jgi:hypothetical protein
LAEAAVVKAIFGAEANRRGADNLAKASLCWARLCGAPQGHASVVELVV